MTSRPMPACFSAEGSTVFAAACVVAFGYSGMKGVIRSNMSKFAIESHYSGATTHPESRRPTSMVYREALRSMA
ncbi:hypothetical protein CF54_14870 [Streptomyces sp. Tu 6176]|nr:hypothetical protein CF54_14870 [Streptomyces sp. Tu 6176]